MLYNICLGNNSERIYMNSTYFVISLNVHLLYLSTGWWIPFVIAHVILLLLAIDRKIPNNDENSKFKN